MLHHVLTGVALATFAATANGQAIIGKKDVVLGVGKLGNLNIPYKGGIKGLKLPISDPLGIDVIGLRVGDGKFSGVERGCLCEGWGVGVESKSVGFFLDSCGVDGSSEDNVFPVAFSGKNGGKKATSRALCGSQKKIQVTHAFSPSKKSGRLFQVKVTIRNLTKKPFPKVIYRRAMDWDIDPTPFNELVTIVGTKGTKNYDSSNDNGFCALNPAVACLEILGGTQNLDFKDSGPTDHGAQFQLNFGKLDAGDSVSFTTYYGVARSEVSAKGAIKAVKAKLYSFGQQSGGGVTGKPATFIWAYKGDKNIKAGKGFLPGLKTTPVPTPAGLKADSAPAGMSVEDKQALNI